MAEIHITVLCAFVFHIAMANSLASDSVNRRDCFYKRNTMICVGTKLTYVPEIPAHIRKFIFKYNVIPAINASSFKNVENPSAMEKIIFTDNFVSNITADAFDIFSKLDYLDLSYNQMYLLDLNFFLEHLSYSLDLRRLVLNKISNNLNVEDILSKLQKSPSKDLFLERNGIKEFPTKVLQRLKHIQELCLDRNMISKIQLIYMESLIALRLSHNTLNIPNFCDESNSSLTPNMKYLYMNHNFITEINKETFKCLFNIKGIQLEYNVISIVRTGIFTYNPKITYIDITGSFGRKPTIQKQAFSSKTLEYINMGFLQSALSLFESINETFVGLPALKSLRIYRIGMEVLSEALINVLFSPLTNITTIECFECNIKGNIKYILNNKAMLRTIMLPGNSLDTFSQGSFSDLPKLERLSLRYNKFINVSQLFLPEKVLNKLTFFDMSTNPFNCDCNIVWFVEWLKHANKLKLKNYPKNYTCASPSKWQGKMLSEVSFSYLECHPVTTPEWIGIIGGPCIVLIAILGVTLYRNRWNIKHYLYIMRKRKSYTEIEGRNYEYDVFIGYNHSDSKWVVDFLMPILEGELNLKACVHDRDFHAGAFINDNIVEFMNKSRRVILVLSNNFASSDWCMFELKLAHSLLVEDSVDVIAVLLENIHGKNMSKPLKVLLDTTTYLEWTETDDVGRNLFVSKLKDSFE